MVISQLFAAKPKPFGKNGAPSSIVKSAVPYLTVNLTSTEEDEQGNKRLHGGAEKVLHQYAPSNYAYFQQAFGEHAERFVPGSIGENISVEGMHDENVFIGDQYVMGGVIVQVGSPRVPCSKISQRYGLPNLDRFVNEKGICGWYYRILQPGIMKVGDKVELIQREEITVSVKDFMHTVNNKIIKRARLLELANIVSLDPEWQQRLKQKARVART